ncbi:MAG TPA: toll/interleukin-1 receptor domain-containing protein [Pyrinomonadaceae bacterium]|nr:toll/interleukin-1 receptor domain-containing protein [Pyrinomonadaceae bacterium]
MSTSGQHPTPRRTGPKVFLSYRRADSYPALGLKDRLTDAFGEGSVFRDDDDIRPGEPFTEAIREAVASCEVFLILISPNWLGALARLREPDDLVRREIADALARPVTLIPLLIDGARMPTPEELPEEVRGLAARQAFPLSQRWWKEDIQRLVDAIRGEPTPPPTRPYPLPLLRLRKLLRAWWHSVALVVLLSAVGFLLWRALSGAPATVTNGNANLISLGRTPAVSPTTTTTPTPTATPLQGDTLDDGCLGRLLPQGRSTSVEYGDAESRVVVRPGQPLGGSAGVLFTENGQPVGALKFSFIRSGDEGVFRIEQVFGPDCRPAADYGSDDRPGVKEKLRNYEYLRMRLGQKYYDLRVVYRPPNTLAVQFMDRPDKQR